MKKKNAVLPGNRKKGKWYLYIGSMPILLAVGWLGGVYLKSASNPTLAMLWENCWCTEAKWGLVFGIVFWLIFCMMYTGSLKKNLEPGKEYGEARFAPPDEILPQIAIDEKTDKILGENLHMGLNDKKTGYNASCLLIGGSGSGKTFRYVAPNLLMANSSFVVTDPKGTLLTDYGNFLLMKGYRVKVIDIQNPYQSDYFNPFSYIRNNADIVRLVNDYIKATTPKNSNETDPFWTKAESKLETAIIQLMLLAYPDDCTMRKFLELLNMCKAKRKDDELTELDKIFDKHKEKERIIWKDDFSGEDVIISGKRAWENYHGVMDAAEDTVRSVIISALARYDVINNSPQLVEMLSGKDTVDFRALGNGYEGRMQKTAIFIISSDIDKTFASIVLWVLTSLYNELYLAARSNKDDRLKIPVQIYLDEFANTPASENILQLFSTARSRGISITAIVQSLGQLKGMFKDESEVIQGACDTLLYMGSSEPSVHKEISAQLGKYTLNKQSHSDAIGTSGNSSKSTDSIGKDLMAQDRVRMLDAGKEIILIRGCEPILDSKYGTQDNPLFQEALRYGKYHYHEHPHSENSYLGPLNEEEVAYCKQHGGKIIHFDVDEFYALRDSDIDALMKDEFDFTPLIGIVQEDLRREHEAMKKSLKANRPSSIKEMLMSGNFTDEQIAQANAGLEAGLSEDKVLDYMNPAFSPERMKTLRLLSVKQAASGAITAAAPLK